LEAAPCDYKQMTMNSNRRQELGEDSLYFHDRCKEIRLMLNDCLIYPKHLQADKSFLRKVKILNYALAEFEDICNRMIISKKSSHNNNNNKQ
jgi:hypothetical protein